MEAPRWASKLSGKCDQEQRGQSCFPEEQAIPLRRGNPVTEDRTNWVQHGIGGVTSILTSDGEMQSLEFARLVSGLLWRIWCSVSPLCPLLYGVEW